MKSALLTLVLILSQAWSAEPTVADLKAQIAGMVTTLASDDVATIRTFITTYAVPEEREQLGAMDDAMITSFIGEKKARLVAALKATADKEPVVTDATYSFTLPASEVETPNGKIEFLYRPDTKLFHIKN